MRLFYICGFIILMAGCSSEPPSQAFVGGAEQTLENFTTFTTKNGRKNWEMTAAAAKIFEKKNMVEVNKFTVDFFSQDGKTVKGRLSAGKGRIDTLKNDFYTEGKSVLKTPDNEVLKTSDLYYKAGIGMIYSDTDVILERKDAVITGKGMEATPDLSSIIIKENLVELKK